MDADLSLVKQKAVDSSVHLDALRGLAAAIVFLSHGRGLFLAHGLRDALTGAHTVASTGANALKAPSIGHEAVIAFFVLSGYFVGGSVLRAERRQKFSWSTYLFQRITRLAVVLVPALILGWALDSAGLHLLHSTQNIYSGPPGSEVAAGLAARLTPLVFLGNLFFVQEILTPCLGTNQPLWSLAYEFWFYIFFPLLVLISSTSKKISLRLLALILLVVLAVFCGWQLCTYFLLWLIGVAVEPLPMLIKPQFRKPAIAVIGLVLILTMYVGLKFPIRPVLFDLLLAFEFAGLTWAILHEQGITVAGPYRWAAQSLSKMSYTLYLVHMPLFVFLCAILLPTYTRWPPTPTSFAKLSSIYILVFAIAYLMYYAFESNTGKLRALLKRHQLSPLPKPRSHP